MALLTAPAVAALLLLFWSAAYGDPQYGDAQLPYKNPKLPVEDRVRDLLGRMTLAEKIGQMTQIERLVASPQVLKDNFIGSLLSGGGSVPRKGATAAEWMTMISDFQKACLSTRLGIPMIYGIDAVHGHNNVYGATIFPHNVGLGATRDPNLVKRIGAATALEVRATGIQYAFAPCIAVCRDPRWGRCYESYSEDHRIVQAMTELIPGLQGDVPQNFTSGMPYVAGKTKVAACAKHFVGDGGTHDGINENNTIIDRQGLMSIHMPAYFDSLRKGVSTVMISYSSWNGIKMHANYDLITGFLKGKGEGKLNFQGFTISDWEGIDRITSPAGSNYSYSVQAGVLAGIDMIMVPNNYQSFISILTGHVNSGVIPMSRIDDAVTRILRVKFTMGLFEDPMPDVTLADQLGKQEHRDLAREAVRKSLVLLQNGKKPGQEPLLPLPKKAAKILVAGSHADNLGYQCGGWTIEWQGDTGRITVGTTILDAVKATVDPSTTVVFAENPDAEFVKNGGFSYAIVVVGPQPASRSSAGTSRRGMLTPLPTAIAEEIDDPKVALRFTHKEDMNPEFIPSRGMRFKTEEEAKLFFLRYAKETGFGINMGNKKMYSRIIRCSCEGHWEYFKNKSGSPQVRNKTSSKTGCMAKRKLYYEYDEYRKLDAAVVEYANLVHNHLLLSPNSAKNHRSHKEETSFL